jgi:glutaredoxin 3
VPGASQVSIRIPRSLLLLPVAALAGYLLFAALGGHGASEMPTASSPVVTAASATAHVHAEPGSASDDAAQPDGIRVAKTHYSRFDAPSDSAGAAGALDAPATAERAAQPVAALQQQKQQNRQALLRAARAQVRVALYYTQTCPYCRAARAYLVAQGIRSEEHDIESDPNARARQRVLNPQGGVPTLEIDDQVVVGFNAAHLGEALDRAALARLDRGADLQ